MALAAESIIAKPVGASSYLFTLKRQPLTWNSSDMLEAGAPDSSEVSTAALLPAAAASSTVQWRDSGLQTAELGSTGEAVIAASGTVQREQAAGSETMVAPPDDTRSRRACN